MSKMKIAVAGFVLAAMTVTGLTLAGGVGPRERPDPMPSVDTADVDTSTVPDMVLGAEEAPITIIEYASFTCPHCATFHAETLPRMKTDYIEPGHVRFIHRAAYFDRYGLWADMIARCGGPDRYFGIADLIYEGQSDWRRGTPEEAVSELRRIGRVSGLTPDTLDACLQDSEKAQTLVAWHEENVAADEVRGTPSFIIAGETVRNQPYADLRALIDRALVDAGVETGD